MNDILTLKNVTIDNLFSKVNLKLKPGEIYCLIGYTGCGKSTLLKIACGLLEPKEGELIFQDQSVYLLNKSQRLKQMARIGFLFQNAALISNLTIFDNLALILRYHTKMKDAEIKEKVDFFLDKFRLLDEADQMPSFLSMGEKKLAAFARALLNNPDILILDEPSALIDKQTEKFMIDMIEEFKSKKKTILMTSNDTELIFNISDRIGVLMEKKLTMEGEPYEIKYSSNKQVKELLSTIKINKEEQVDNEILKLLK